jgi:hypothetical protein
MTDIKNLKSETVDRLRGIYIENKEIIEYMCKFGSKAERIKASIVRDIALSES